MTRGAGAWRGESSDAARFRLSRQDARAVSQVGTDEGAQWRCPAGAQPEACQAFYRQGAERLIGDLATYLRRANAAGSLRVRNPRRAADLFLAMFLGDGHIRGLLMLDMPDKRENKALLREAVRVFMAAYGAGA